MIIDSTTIFVFTLYSSIIFYFYFRKLEKRKKAVKMRDLYFKRLNYSDIELALLGEGETVDILENPNPFLNLEKTNEGVLPVVLISQSGINTEGLNAIRKDTDWLINVLKRKGYNDINFIKHAYLDKTGIIRVIEKS